MILPIPKKDGTVTVTETETAVFRAKINICLFNCFGESHLGAIRECWLWQRRESGFSLGTASLGYAVRE